jgi:hypothetical protein
MRLLETLKNIGSSQNVSEIIPIEKEKTTVFYDKNGKKR